jgi:hypothetical protein
LALNDHTPQMAAGHTSALMLARGRGAEPRRAPRGEVFRVYAARADAEPLGVKMFSYRRVKNDERDAADLADLLRMGRLPEAWIAPPATRELRGWVRHRAKLVGLRRRGQQLPTTRTEQVTHRHLNPAAVAGGLAVAGDRGVGLRDRHLRQAGHRPAAHRSRVHRDPGHSWGGADPGRGVRRRGR